MTAFGKIKPENLPIYLKKIHALFPEFVENKTNHSVDVERYYSESFWGYAVFHSWAGAIHMALSPSGTFSKNDYFRQAEEVAVAIADVDSNTGVRILEIGCGRGFNLQYLAQSFSQHSFVGIDVSNKNLMTAEKQLKYVNNICLHKDDFHFLNKIEDSTIDVAFAVESFCHASDLRLALSSVSRVLKPGGRLIVFDGFRSEPDAYKENLLTALKYAEQAMAVPRFFSVDEFVSKSKEAGLVCENVQDRSAEIMPNLIRLSDLAKGFFKIDLLSRVIMALTPRGLVTNAIAGLLMAVTVQSGAHRYVKLSLQKESHKA